jgi:hypothetical protein
MLVGAGGVAADEVSAVLKAHKGQTVGAVLRRVGRPKAGDGNPANGSITCSTHSPAYLAARLRRDHPEALAAFREAIKHQGERTDLVDNVNEVMDRPDGNSRAYSLSRVQRECDAETVASTPSPRAVTLHPPSPHRLGRGACHA